MCPIVLLYYMINTISDVKHQYEREDGVGQVESAQSNMEAAVNGQLPQNQDVTGSKRKGISGSTIKIIAVIAMVIDHFAAVVLARQMIASGYLDAMNSGIFEEVMGWLNDNMLLYYSYDLMRTVGRLGFPIFCFLMVEGFMRTKNIKSYLLRMGIFALVSEIPFDLAMTGKFFYWGYQNVFFTLFLGLFTLWAFDFFGKQPFSKFWGIVAETTGALLPAAYITMTLANLAGVERISSILLGCGVITIFLAILILVCNRKYGQEKVQTVCADISVLLIVMYLADLLYTDYSGMGVLTIAVMYFFRKSKVKSMVAGCIVLFFMNINEWFAFLSIIPVAMYNGKRGLKMKYFFYAFYPVHLLILYLICYFLGWGGISVM